MKALITGATGLVGRRLVERLPSATILTRSPERAAASLGPVQAYAWEPLVGPPPTEAFRNVEAVFNLAGEPVSHGRWSADKKRAIYDSRITGTRNLVAGLAQLERKPKVLVSASAIGIYGDRGDEVLDESSEPGSGFLAEVCVDWEREAMAATKLGVRVVCVRIGIVLSSSGGILARMITPFKLGVGGRLGSGSQWMSWIHIDDLVDLFVHASRCETCSGPMNAVSPEPIRNSEFTRSLGQSLHRPTLLPMPKAALRLAFGEMSEIMLASQRVVPRAALESGYPFEHTELSNALTRALSPAPTRAA